MALASVTGNTVLTELMEGSSYMSLAVERVVMAEGYKLPDCCPVPLRGCMPTICSPSPVSAQTFRARVHLAYVV